MLIFVHKKPFQQKKVNNYDIDDAITVLAIIVALLNRTNTHSAYHAVLQEFVYLLVTYQNLRFSSSLLSISWCGNFTRRIAGADDKNKNQICKFG